MCLVLRDVNQHIFKEKREIIPSWGGQSITDNPEKLAT